MLNIAENPAIIKHEVSAVQTNDFEEAFGNYIDCGDYDEAETALFDMIRMAFLAGWRSAGGDPPQPRKIFELIPGKDEESEEK